MSSEFKSGIGADFRQRELGLIPHDQPGGPLPRNLGAFCGQIAPMVSVLPVVPVRKYCAVYYLALDSYHGMEEVIGSIPIRSTNYVNNLEAPPLSDFVAFFRKSQNHSADRHCSTPSGETSLRWQWLPLSQICAQGHLHKNIGAAIGHWRKSFRFYMAKAHRFV